jgi:hypothetical protein
MLAKRLGVARTTVGTYFSRGNTAPSGVKVTALLNSINEEFGIEIPFAWVYDGQPGPVPGVPTRGVTSQAAERKAIVSRLAVEKSLESLEASRQASGLGYTATAVLRLQDAVGILLSALVLSSAVSE